MSPSTPDGVEWTPASFLAARRARQPTFVAAVAADTKLTAERRGERHEFRSRLDAFGQLVRLLVQSDALFAQVCYRAKVDLQVRGIPFVPRILHRLAMGSAQVSIGDPVVVEAGVYLPHGQVVIDGLAEIGAGTAISPWVTIGLLVGDITGPTIGRDVRIGSGAKVLGPVEVGDGARIGANSVVLDDVAPGTTVVGVPAREVRRRDGDR